MGTRKRSKSNRSQFNENVDDEELRLPAIPPFNPFNIGMNPFNLDDGNDKKPIMKSIVIMRPKKNLKGISNVNQRTPIDFIKKFDQAFDNFFDDEKKEDKKSNDILQLENKSNEESKEKLEK